MYFRNSLISQMIFILDIPEILEISLIIKEILKELIKVLCLCSRLKHRLFYVLFNTDVLWILEFLFESLHTENTVQIEYIICSEFILLSNSVYCFILFVTVIFKIDAVIYTFLQLLLFGVFFFSVLDIWVWKIFVDC